MLHLEKKMILLPKWKFILVTFFAQPTSIFSVAWRAKLRPTGPIPSFHFFSCFPTNIVDLHRKWLPNSDEHFLSPTVSIQRFPVQCDSVSVSCTCAIHHRIEFEFNAKSVFFFFCLLVVTLSDSAGCLFAFVFSIIIIIIIFVFFLLWNVARSLSLSYCAKSNRYRDRRLTFIWSNCDRHFEKKNKRRSRSRVELVRSHELRNLNFESSNWFKINFSFLPSAFQTRSLKQKRM